MKTVWTWALCLWAAAAAAADMDVVFAPGRGGDDDAASHELKWDNGTRQYFVWWYTGMNAWVGNDFENALTPGAGARVKSIKVHTTRMWPNNQWDGFGVALFRFDGRPGEILWPTGEVGYSFFKPASAAGHIWAEAPVNWVATSADFVAAVNQLYNAPQCDPFAVDSNPSFRGHSWRYNTGNWEKFQSTADPYRNLMIRVVVDKNATGPTVAPASFGRVKALFY